MKHVIIGDIHGNPIWEDIVKKYLLDDVKFIFIGDYFDSFVYKPIEQIENFKKIWEFSKKNDCVLLMGNHDLHYLTDIDGVKCSGYNSLTQLLLDNFQRDNEVKLLDMLKYIYRFEINDSNYICSHAGFTKTWLEKHNLDLLESDINTYIRENLSSVSYDYTETDRYGNSIHQGPLWVRPKSLEKDTVPMVHQIVGHTEMNITNRVRNGFNVFWYIDNFKPNRREGWYLEVDSTEVRDKFIKI